MKHEHFVVQTPAAQLILLFHGVGDNPVAMGEIGSYFAKDFPQAQVVSIGGPEAFGNGAGRQWPDRPAILRFSRKFLHFLRGRPFIMMDAR